ncbi:sugar ABC transporter permease [Paenibacillus sp. TRM 82003]|nr:sugar ABC transporter permease [Paenibacillus sp. TRM 82003]
MQQKPTPLSTAKALLYLLPALVLIVAFNVYPIVTSLAMSFYTDYDYFKGIVYEYGFDNFVYLWNDPKFWVSIRNTFIFVLGVVPLSMAISMAVALLLNMNLKLRGLFRTIYFLPFVTSVVAVSTVWRWIYHTEYGVMNYALGAFGVDPIKWLTDPAWAMPSLILMCVWKGLGYNIIIFLAGLQNIDKQYYLAARVDGAPMWERFKHVTVPLLSPTTFFITIISVINSFKVFDEIYALFGNKPGPVDSALTVVYYIFEKFYAEWDFGVASAAAYVLFVVIFLFTIIQLYVGKKNVHY